MYQYFLCHRLYTNKLQPQPHRAALSPSQSACATTPAHTSIVVFPNPAAFSFLIPYTGLPYGTHRPLRHLPQIPSPHQDLRQLRIKFCSHDRDRRAHHKAVYWHAPRALRDGGEWRRRRDGCHGRSLRQRGTNVRGAPWRLEHGRGTRTCQRMVGVECTRERGSRFPLIKSTHVSVRIALVV